MHDFRGLINKWPLRTALAEEMRVSQSVVSRWYERNSIPANYWSELLKHACARKIKLTADDLVGFKNAS